jgi:hypothetical protein
MDLTAYFENASGFGVMATADAEGRTNAAVYARPHVMDDATVAFIMRDRLTHANLQANGHATYLFKEKSPGYKGHRLYLSKIREEQDTELVASLGRKQYPDAEDKTRFLVFFKIDKVLPLIGDGT